MKQDIWREIGTEKWNALTINRAYAVSTLGRVASAAFSGRISIMRPSDNGRGYKLIKLTTPKRQNFYIHRLVAQAFLPNPDGLPEVNHIDGDKTNNRVSNLEWVTVQQNRDHAKATGLQPVGERAGHAKLKERDVVEIMEALKINPKLNKTQLGRKYGVGCEAIIKLEKGQRWKHITTKYIKP